MSSYVPTWLIAASLVIQGVGVAARAQEPVPVKREILALYDGAQESEADFTRIHRLAEMPLNHLGFILRFHDIRVRLPDPADIERYRGVLTWFAGSVSNGAYLAWASQVSRRNVRYVILGDVGVAINSANILVVNQLLDQAGVRHTGEYVAPTFGTYVAQEEESLVEFECRLGPVVPDYPVILPSGTGTRVGVMLETPSYDGRRKSTLVAIGEKGAYAAWNYEFCHQREPLYQGQWLINPFAFFRAAFDSGDEPIPDTTTASGNRLYFSLLESEGLTRPSKIEGFRDASAAAGDVILRELIEPYHDLPTTIEVLSEEAAKYARRGTQTQMLLQRILANRNVDLLQRGMQVTRSRFDSEYPSISNLSPLISAGPDHFINRPMSDETAYNNQSAVGENGFSALQETVAGTDSPRRLKPFDLDYHVYAGEYPALLRSVKDQLSAASRAAITPVSANRYAAIVDGFFSARIDRIGSATWRISNRGALQTLRFDAAEGREVDFQSSVGVIGQKRNGSKLYVALDEAIEPVVVALGPRVASRAVHHGDLALVESRWLVRHVVKGPCAFRFEAQGYGAGSFTWSTAALGRYAITVDQADQEIARQTAEADDAGSLKFVLPVSAIDPLTVRINCAAAARAADQ
ncbi:MAG: hypothetical protein JO283_16455 [Bradyrhizobium sp.]|nr:hypothetical protein [Bradyrhizobium sp.]